MSKKQTKQSRATQLRKQKQAEDRYMKSLRQKATEFEGITARTAASMSLERLEEVVRRGKRRHGLTSAPIGPSLALAAAGLLRNR